MEIVRRLLLRAGTATVVLVAVVALLPASSNAFTGGLALTGCVELGHGDGCTTTVSEPPYAKSITISPDGQDVYVLVYGTIYDVQPHDDGTSAAVRCYAASASNGCASLPMIDGEVHQLVVSADGTHAYLGADRDIVVLSRDPATGALAELQCLGDTSTTACPTPGGSHLVGGTQLALSPDRRFLDVAGGNIASGLSVTASFLRAADGTLSEISCLASVRLAGCSTSSALSYPRSVEESPDGVHVYDTGLSSIFTLARDESGALHVEACLTGDASADPSCTAIGPFAQTVDDLVLAPAGNIAYASSGGTLWHLAVQANGSLLPSGCDFPYVHPTECEPGTEEFSELAITPDAETLYLAGGEAYALGPIYGAYFGSGIAMMGASAIAVSNDNVYIFASGGLFMYVRDHPPADQPAAVPVAPTTTAPPTATPVTAAKGRARVVVDLVRPALLHLRRHGTSVTFHCPSPHCNGTIRLLRGRRVIASHRFVAGKHGRVHVALRLPTLPHKTGKQRTRLQLQIHATAPGLAPQTVLEAVSITNG